MALVYILVIATHELGHAVYFYYKKRPIRWRIVRYKYGFKIKLGRAIDYIGLTHEDIINLNLSGILGGLLLICLFSLWYPYLFLLLIGYFFGCLPDIRNIKRANDNLKLERGYGYIEDL